MNAINELHHIQDRMSVIRQSIESQMTEFNQMVKQADKIAEDSDCHMGLHDEYKSYAHNTILSQLSKSHGFFTNSCTLDCIERQIDNTVRELRQMR